MASIQKSNYTICDAFDIVGWRLHGDDWVGKQPHKLRFPVIASAEDMRKATEPSRHAPDLPTEEITLPLHFEANARTAAGDEEERAARRRCIGAETKLRQIMSDYDIHSVLRGSESGRDWQIKQADWAPANYNIFWVNVASGLCGYNDERPDCGEGLIDRVRFDAAIHVEYEMIWPASKSPKQPHPGFSENWLLAPEFTIEELIYLWCDWEPGLIEKDKDVVAVVEERLKLLPDSKPIQAMLWAALWSGELPCLHSGHVQFPWFFLSKRQQKTTYWPHIVFSRDAVKEFATKKGYRPKFLFPEEGHPLATTGLTQEKRSEGGRKEKYSKPFQFVVDSIQKRLGQKVTVKKFLDDLLEQIAESPFGELSLLGCENICVAGNGAITWDEVDKSGFLDRRSIQPYLNRANDQA